MDNTREKLIELLKDTRANAAWHHWGYEESADHLIANGVTIQKWIPVTERLPDKDGAYLVRWANKSVGDAEYECKYGSFGYWIDIMWDEDADWFPYVDITHWMPLPEPPKGD